ncbi:MAG: NADH-quinone oxidoreductase subunit J [Planctomycetota bacterium]|nr:NADH-quinone oxidoreductase subunit J [Planctomycetota bacterium]
MLSPWLEHLIFSIVAIVAVAGSILVVTRRNPIYSALFLIVVFGTVSAMFMLLDAPFLGFMQLLVYAGAIMVLYLFVIMLINPRDGNLPKEGGAIENSFAGGVSLLIFSLLAFAISHSGEVERLSNAGGIPALPEVPLSHGGIAGFGLELFHNHLLVFELTSVLILVGIIGAVHLAMRRKSTALTSEEAAEGAVTADV